MPDVYRPVVESRTSNATTLEPHQTHTNHVSAVSWGAIFAGAAGAASLSLILLILGTGLGLSAVSPWSSIGITATTFGISTVIWITFTQLIASGMGGYLAGRLRQKWVNVHTDESYFRDTAHGFLAWAVATLITVTLLGSAVGSIVSGGFQAGASVASGAASTAASGAIGTNSSNGGISQAAGYFVDSLFRRDLTTAASTTGAAASSTNSSSPSNSGIMANSSSIGIDASSSGETPTAEVTRIFTNSLRNGVALPADDVRYIGQTVAQRTGLSQQDAEKRVTENYSRIQTSLRDAETKAKSTADQTRKATSYASLWLFVSLLIGAFFASLAATYGGRRRDL